MFLFVFLDGIGIGPDSAENPFSVAKLPAFERLSGGRLITGVSLSAPNQLAKPIDANLGVQGLPQSATGQTALFTGVNGPQLEGMHISAFPTRALREAIAEHSILKQASEAGYRVTFANAFSQQYWDSAACRRNRHSATTWTNIAADLPFRDFDDLSQGKAVYWDITHEIASASYAPELPYVPPSLAGERLAALAVGYDLVLYETFLPDLVGHRRIDMSPIETLLRIDDMLAGVMGHLPSQATILITSDHGNLEDPTTKGHTYNPVPLLVWGPGAQRFEDVSDLTGITPAILAYLAEMPLLKSLS